MSLQVLSLSGRRHTVKISQNTALLQVLEEVCKKEGNQSPDDYELIHGKKVLDLSLTFRFSNLPNNAKLELRRQENIQKSTENVLIALQLESGERLQQEFVPATSLWDVLQHWEQQPNSPHAEMLTRIDASVHPPLHPVCIYMRDEVIGEYALQETSLKKLGLTKGKAVIRLIHRPVDDLMIATILDEISRNQSKQAKLENIAQRRIAELQQSDESVSKMSIDSSDSSSLSLGDKNTDTIAGASNRPINNIQTSTVGRKAAEPSPEPMDVDVTSRSSMGDPLARLSQFPGVQVFRPEDFLDMTPEEQEMAQRLAQRIMPQLGLVSAARAAQPAQPAARPKQKQQPLKQQRQPFAEFKFPEATKGQNLYHNDLNEVSREEFKPCDRDPVLFSYDEPQSGGGVVTQEDFPDDFFDITETDIQNMLKDNMRKVQMIDDEPLMTQAMRRFEFEQKMNQYDRTVIRVQFPDKLILQGLFRPMESVFALHKFVKEHLEEKNQPFYLYTSPPKCVLKDMAKSLVEAHLVPAAVIYLGSDNPKDHYLSKKILSDVSTKARANAIVSSSLTSKTTASSSASDQHKTGSTSSKTDKTVPKWLKMGKK